jgi:hypothetical protein
MEENLILTEVAIAADVNITPTETEKKLKY